MKLFTGTSNKPLAQAIAKRLKMKLERTDVSRFSDGESRAEIMDVVRGCKAFIIQSTCAPANDTLMELLLLTDALQRAAVESVTAIIPFYGYARQDRRPGYARVPISARVVADMLTTAGVDHVVTVDLHASQIQGFFDNKVPVDNISAIQLFVADSYGKYVGENPVVVSPDAGGVARARHFAKLLNNADLAIVDKRRPKANASQVMNIIGDVKDSTCILVDDLVDTAGTLAKAADALMENGARKVVAYCTHAVLSGQALENIEKSSLAELVVTDTIPQRPEFVGSKVRFLSMANILAETIDRIDNKKSISYILD
ncbi:MAG: ribose-phosphate pyrophosphokinase [Candidatus Thorarchaeota archaeon]|nr:MAG: ribose-phosphate pyrophosphokinase [Candidatus Thorarchaeota archaeon]